MFIKLQDRTQFSDRDLYTLKRYWDNGMTSLGSLCKEKISAAADELGVDTEIIKVRSLYRSNFLVFFFIPTKTITALMAEQIKELHDITS